MEKEINEKATFEVGNFIIDISAKTPQYVQAEKLNPDIERINEEIRKKILGLNIQYYKEAREKKMQKINIANTLTSPNRLIEPIFNIKNFRVNENRRWKIENNINQNILITDIKLPTELGLIFDESTHEIYGIARIAGDYTISFLWSLDDQSKSSASIKISIIDDPKNLWKNLPSDVNDKYYKDDKDKKEILSDGYQIFATSQRGRSHAHVGSFRDDDFYIYSDEANKYNILIVADGAGSAKYSRHGSKTACVTAGDSIKNKFFIDIKNIQDEIALLYKTGKERPVKEIFYNILGDAFKCSVDAIEDESKLASALYKDFSTTLLVAITFKIYDKLFVASAMVGDGAISIYNENVDTIKLLGDPDSGEFAGQTRFLDNTTLTNGFWERVNISLVEIPTAVLLMTDGVSDPYFETENGLKDKMIWNNLWNDIRPNIEHKDPCGQLIKWLDFFVQGHHDDRTIVVQKF